MKLILVIDDSEDHQALLEMIFLNHGYQVLCASNGLDALTLLKELTTLPSLILLDACMPVMDGYQFRIEQRKNDRLREIPVVVMSGDDDIQMVTKMNEPVGVLVKPIDFKTLIDRIDPYFEHDR